MLRKVSLWEEISSFAHSEKRWVAKLECGHEVSVPAPGAERSVEIECPQCADDPEWKQTLSVVVKDGENVVSRGRYPVEIESDDDGPFAVMQPVAISVPPDTAVSHIEIEIRSSNAEWQERIRTAFLDRPEPGEPDA